MKKTTAKNGPARDVDEYLAGVPKEARVTLEKLRKTIQSAAPMAAEVISYQIPMYKYNGPLVAFAAFPGHCSLFVINKNILKMFEKELQSYKTSGTTIHFTPDKPLPAGLIQKIVKTRIRENAERIVTKKTPIRKVRS